MEATLRLARRATYADYLAAETASPLRHEFLDGVIVAMAGGSDEHNALTAKLAMVLGARVGGQCRFYSPDQRFWIAARSRARYPDGSIIGGKPEHPAHDAQATLNPSVVIEVLSPSSEGDDAGDKRLDFQSLAALQAYLLVDQDERRIQVFRRDPRGDWPLTPDVYRDGDTIDLPTLTAAFAVADVYAGILDDSGRSLLR